MFERIRRGVDAIPDWMLVGWLLGLVLMALLAIAFETWQGQFGSAESLEHRLHLALEDATRYRDQLAACQAREDVVLVAEAQ